MKTGLSQQVHNNAIKLARGVASFYVNKNGKLKHSSVTSSIIAVTLIFSIMISLFSTDKIGRAQNYDKIWTSTADFNSGTNSNVDTGGNEAKLVTSTTDFSEGFTNATYKDAATDANWDTTSHKLTLPGDPTNGITTDLQAKWKGAVGASEDITCQILDSTNGIIYLGGGTNNFGAYKISDQSLYVLTSKFSADWGANGIFAFAIDTTNNFLYLGGNNGRFGAYSLATNPNDGTWTNLNSKITASWGTNQVRALAFDAANGFIYLGGAAGTFGAYSINSSPGSGTFSYLNSLITASWGTNHVWSLGIDTVNHFLYLGGGNGAFGSLSLGANPSSGTFTWLYSRAFNSPNLVRSMVFDAPHSAMYLVGDTTSIGAYVGGSTPATGTYYNLQNLLWYNGWGLNYIYTVTLDTTNSILYVGGNSGRFAAISALANPANAALTMLSAKVSTEIGSNNVISLIYNSANGLIYLGGSATATFGSYNGGVNPANGTWTNLTSSVAGIFVGTAITSSAYDSTNEVLYLGGIAGQFMSYKISDGTATGLTSKLSSDWGANNLQAMTFDSANGIIYIGSNNGRFGAFYGGATPSAGTWTYLTAKISSDWGANQVQAMTFDATNAIVYLSGQTGKFGAYVGGSNPADGIYASLGAKLSDWSGNGVPALTYDLANGILYMGGRFGKFGAFNGGSNPAAGTYTALTAKISANWGSSHFDSLTFDTTSSKVYLGSDDGKLGAFTGGSNPSTGTWDYLTAKISADWGANAIYSLIYVNGRIFLGGASGKFGFVTAVETASNDVWTNLTTSLSGAIGTNAISTMLYVSPAATIYVGPALGKFSSFLIGYTTNKNGLSTKVNTTSQAIYKATLTATESKPANTAITYQLSNDGGSHWDEVTSGVEFTFNTAASDLRWRAILTTTDPAVTPSITGIAISYRYFTSNSGTMSLVFDASQAVTPTLLSWTDVLAANTTLTFKIRSASTQDDLATADWSDIKNAADTPVNLKALNVGGSTGVAENQFFEIFVSLTTTDGMATPVLSDLTMQYVINQPPAIQNVVASQRTDGSKIVNISYDLKDSDTHTNPYNQDQVSTAFQYSTDSGSTWHECAAITNGGLRSVNADGSWTSQSATWDAGADLADQYFDGTMQIKVLANDNEQAHNTAESSSGTFTLDTKNPVLGSITGGYTGLKIGTIGNWTNDNTPDLALLSTDDTTVQMEIRNDSNFTGTRENYAAAKAGWSLAAEDGTKTVYVRFYDAFGNYTDASHTILLDTTAPAVPGHFTLFDTSNSDLGTYTITSIWDPINNPGDFNKYSLERSTNGTDFSELATFSNLAADVYADKDLSPENSYYYRLRTEDIHNNYSSYTEIKDLRPAGTDTVPPEITGPGPTSQAFATTANVTWITSEPADSYVEFGTSESYGSNQGSDELVTNHSVTVIGLQPTTTYHYRVKSRDGNSNKVTSADYTFTTTLPEDSQSSLSITGATAQKPGANPEEVTIIWTTDKYATSQVLYGKTETLGQQTDEDNTLNKTHYVTIGGLEPNTKYYYKARSKDTYSNVVDGETKFFVTAQNDTNSASTAAINFVEISDITMNSAIVSWQTVTVATSAVEIGSGEGYSGRVEDISTGSTTQHVVRLKDLKQGTEYHFRVMGQNAAGAWLASDNYKFSTVPEPAISQIAIKNIASTSATISWKTNVLTDSTVDYGTDNLSLSQGSGVNVTDHEVNLTSLKAATKYQFSIRIRDGYGNSITSVPMDFQTIIDTTGPVIRDMKSETSIITDQTGNTKAQAIISWSTDEPSTAQVKYAMGVATSSDYPLSTTEDTNLSTSHVVIISNLNPSATYHMKLVSKDASNNISVSDDYTVLTLNQDKSLLQYIVQILEERFSWLKGMGLF